MSKGGIVQGAKIHFKLLLLAVVMAATSACGAMQAVAPQVSLTPDGWIPKKECFTKTVLYGTTRHDKCEDTTRCEKSERYETGNNYKSKNIKYGYVEVKIPYVKEIGKTTGMSILSISDDVGWENFKDKIASDDLLIFIHGYNTSFNEAAIRCAQLAYDLNYKGVPILYSWPSKDRLSGVADYEGDKVRAKENYQYLAGFLANIADASSRKIHIIAHSMGTDVLTGALAEIDKKMSTTPHFLSERKAKNGGRVFNQVVYAAPDIAEEAFADNFESHNLKHLSAGYTLYSIKNDDVLKASRLFNLFIEDDGGPRVGDSSLSFFTINGMHTVDSRLEVIRQTFGHSYYAQERPLVTDLFLLLNYDALPENRMLLSVKDKKDQQLWFLRP